MHGVKLGKKIKQLRIERDLKQGDIASAFRFKNYQQVSKWETGDLFPSIDQLVTLSDMLQYNLFEVLLESYKEYSLSSDDSPKNLLGEGEALSDDIFEEPDDFGGDDKSKVPVSRHKRGKRNLTDKKRSV